MTMMMSLFKKSLQLMVIGLLTWLFIIWVRPGILTLLVYFLILNVVVVFVSNLKDPLPFPAFRKAIATSILYTSAMVAGTALLSWLFGGHVIWSFFIIIIFIAILRIIQQRKLYMDTIRTVEKGLYGETMEERRERKHGP